MLPACNCLDRVRLKCDFGAPVRPPPPPPSWPFSPRAITIFPTLSLCFLFRLSSSSSLSLSNSSSSTVYQEGKIGFWRKKSHTRQWRQYLNKNYRSRVESPRSLKRFTWEATHIFKVHVKTFTVQNNLANYGRYEIDWFVFFHLVIGSLL